MKDYYQILGIEKDANHIQIKKAYKELVMKYHPDSGGDESTIDKFHEVQEAYEVLGDQKKRADYDFEYFYEEPVREEKPEAEPQPEPEYEFDAKKAEAYEPTEFAEEKEIFEEFYKKFTNYIEGFSTKKKFSLRKIWTNKDKQWDKRERLKRIKDAVASSLDEEIRLMEIQKEYLLALYNFKKSIDDLEDFNPYFWLKEIPSNMSYYEGRIEYYRSRVANQ